jgi:Trypsin-co-occurring domain 2
VRVTDQGVAVDTLISVVKDSIRQAGVSRAAQAGDLQVASVRLILDVVASKTAGGGLDFRVPFIGMRLTVGAKVTKKDTHTIDIALVPPEDRDTRQVRGEVEDALVNAIATIRNVMTKAAEGDDPWLLSAGTIDISFAITRTGTISVGVDGELASELTHTLRLELAPTPALPTALAARSAKAAVLSGGRLTVRNHQTRPRVGYDLVTIVCEMPYLLFHW